MLDGTVLFIAFIVIFRGCYRYSVLTIRVSVWLSAAFFLSICGESICIFVHLKLNKIFTVLLKHAE